MLPKELTTALPDALKVEELSRTVMLHGGPDGQAEFVFYWQQDTLHLVTRPNPEDDFHPLPLAPVTPPELAPDGSLLICTLLEGHTLELQVPNDARSDVEALLVPPSEDDDPARLDLSGLDHKLSSTLDTSPRLIITHTPDETPIEDAMGFELAAVDALTVGDFEGARDHLSHAIRLSEPSEKRALTRAAEALLAVQRDVLEDALFLLLDSPTTLVSDGLLGLIAERFDRLGNRELAATARLRQIDDAPGEKARNTLAVLDMTEAELHKHVSHARLEYFERAHDKGRADALLFEQLATANAEHGNPRKALSFSRLAAQAQPDRYDALLTLASSLLEQDDEASRREGIERLKTLAQRHPDTSEPLLQLALYFTGVDDPRALDYLEQALERDADLHDLLRVRPHPKAPSLLELLKDGAPEPQGAPSTPSQDGDAPISSTDGNLPTEDPGGMDPGRQLMLTAVVLGAALVLGLILWAVLG